MLVLQFQRDGRYVTIMQTQANGDGIKISHQGQSMNEAIAPHPPPDSVPGSRTRTGLGFIFLNPFSCRHTGLQIQHTKIQNIFLNQRSSILQDLKGGGQHHTLLYHLVEDLECALERNMHDWKFSHSCIMW
jgi:hypothetical protein